MVAKCLLQLCLALGGLVLGLLDLQHLLYNLLLLNQKCPNDPLPNCGTRQNTTIWTVHSPPVPWQPGPLVLSRSEVRNLQSKQVQYLWECPYCSHDNANATQTCENLISLKLPISINENVVKATNICLHANTECSIKLLWLWKGGEWF